MKVLKFGIKHIEPSDKAKDMPAAAAATAESIVAALESMTYDGADPNLVLSRVAAIERDLANSPRMRTGTAAQRAAALASLANGSTWLDTDGNKARWVKDSVWKALDRPLTTLAFASGFSNEVGVPTVQLVNGQAVVSINAFRSGWTGLATICTIPAWARPEVTVTIVGQWANSVIELKIEPSGLVTGNPGTIAKNGVIGFVTYPVKPMA